MRRIYLRVKQHVIVLLGITMAFLLPLWFGLGYAEIWYLGNDSAQAAIMGALITLVAWGLGHIVSGAILRSADEALFAIAPLTVKRYVLRNIQIRWPVFLYLLLLPAALVWYWFHVHVSGSFGLAKWDLHNLINAVLVYFVALLGPLSESSPFPVRLSYGFFAARHGLIRVVLPLIPIALIGGIVNWLYDGVVVDWILAQVAAFLALGPLAWVVATLLFPAVGPVVQSAAPAGHWFATALTAYLVAVLVEEFSSIIRSFTKEQRTWEVDNTQAYIDQRDDLSEQEEQKQIEMDESFTKQFAFADGFAKGISGDTEYGETLSPERVVVKERVRVNSADTRPQHAVWLPFYYAFNYPAISMVLALACVSLWVNRGSSDGVLPWMGVAVGIGSAYAAGGRMRETIETCLSLPVRQFRLGVLSLSAYATRDLVRDALVIGFALIALPVSPVWAIVFWLTLRVVHLTGGLATMLSLRASLRSNFYLNTQQLTGVVALFSPIVYSAVVFENNEANFLDNWILLITALAFGLFTGILVLWTHRGCDSTPLRTTGSFLGN